MARALTLACLLTAAASAQQALVWTDPSGRFSLSYAESGWTDEGEAGDRSYLLLLQHRAFVEQSGRSRVCAVRQQRQRIGPADTDQATLNAITERLDKGRIEFIHLGAEMTSLARVRVGGVAVADYTLTFNERWQRWRTFYLPGPDTPVRVDVGCVLLTPVSDAEQASAAAFVESLSFNLRVTP